MVEVVVTDEFRAWYEPLTQAEQESIERGVIRLAKEGTTLGYPHSSAVTTSRYGGMRELRIQHQGRPYRVLYAFDPARQAVLLIGGDKTGNDRFYVEMVPVADCIWETYLNEQYPKEP